MTPLDEMSRDLDWREAEMAVLRIMLSHDMVTERQKLVLFRAGWALLYAHYEGFCKFCFIVYYNAIENLQLKNKQIAVNTQAFALNAELKAMRNLPSVEFLSTIANFNSDIMDRMVSFPDVDTESNLWPSILKRLLDDADIAIASLDANSNTLTTLVSRRNKIAHGERDMITEYKYYVGFEEAVKTVMYDLALAIDEKIKQSAMVVV